MLPGMHTNPVSLTQSVVFRVSDVVTWRGCGVGEAKDNPITDTAV